MAELILASGSVYRQEILARLKIPFRCYTPNVDESQLPNESIAQMVLRLSQAKAQVAANHFPQSVCIGSDEVAGLGNIILGKPLNYENAVVQLKSMSGQEVIFYTGLCVLSSSLNHIDCRLSTTKVLFKQLNQKQIDNYLNKEQPYHSAGSFKSETLGCALLESCETDDPTAIIGLPLISLCQMLNAVGIEVI